MILRNFGRSYLYIYDYFGGYYEYFGGHETLCPQLIRVGLAILADYRRSVATILNWSDKGFIISTKPYLNDEGSRPYFLRTP